MQISDNFNWNILKISSVRFWFWFWFLILQIKKSNYLNRNSPFITSLPTSINKRIYSILSSWIWIWMQKTKMEKKNLKKKTLDRYTIPNLWYWYCIVNSLAFKALAEGLYELLVRYSYNPKKEGPHLPYISSLRLRDVEFF